jgi:Secretion system C-terminal sorting domain/F5/8 type C domain
MKKIILFCLLVFIPKAFSQINLVTTAIITASSTNPSYPTSNVKDGNISTIWQSSGTGSQNLNITLVNTIRYATVNLTNVVSPSGFSIQFSPDNTTWTTVASYSGSVSSFVKSNLYLLNSNQFLPYKYIRIQMASQGNSSLAEVVITEGSSLISSFTGANCSTGHPLINAVDFNTSTYYENYNENFSLTLQLSRSVGAINASINASIGHLKVSLNGPNGIVDGYYYTLNPVEQFLIVNPSGIQSVTFTSNGSLDVNDVTLEEVLLSNVSMPFTYDAGGNMILRTILFSSSKSAREELRDTIIPANPEFGIEKPYTDEFAGKQIFVYPIPTKGLLSIDFKNLSENDKIAIQLYSVTGQKLLEETLTGSSTVIDLQNRTNGTYFLNIQVNSETHKWTIIKE